MSKYHLFLVDEVGGLHHQLHELVGVGAPLVQVLQGVLEKMMTRIRTKTSYNATKRDLSN